VKSGQIDPAALTADAALALLLAEPLLIRRPLIEVDGWRTAGYDAAVLERRLGIRLGDDTPQGCSRKA
jgi:arsenate reductase-like glutaredoxin family protein